MKETPQAIPSPTDHHDVISNDQKQSVEEAKERNLKRLQNAKIAYNTPERIRLGRSVSVQLKLSTSVSAEALKKTITEPGKKEGTSVQVSEAMVASLVGDDGLTVIRTVGTDHPQEVDPDGINTWEWSVKGTSPGTHHLHLTLNAVVRRDGLDVDSQVQTFNRAITVEVTLMERVAGFFGNNWQWLWTVAVVPAAGIAYSRFGREKPSTEVSG